MYNCTLKKLILSFRLQESGAFEMIYDEFKDLIYYYARKQRNEDIIGELTLSLIELLYRIDLNRFYSDKSEDIKKYITVAIKNKYISILRKQMKESIMLSDFPEEDFVYDSQMNMYVDMNEAFDGLTNRQKRIIICKYIYCLSDVQISEILKISRQAVNRLKNRAIKVLKEYYSM